MGNNQPAYYNLFLGFKKIMINSSPKDVLLRQSHVTFDESVNVIQMNDMVLTQQSFNTLSAIQVVEIFDDEDKKHLKKNVIFFRVSCGIRLVDSDTSKGDKTLFEIRAEHDVSFEADGKLTKEELETFSSSDLIINETWPYWKEHVKSLSQKAGIQNLTVPNPKQSKLGIKLKDPS